MQIKKIVLPRCKYYKTGCEIKILSAQLSFRQNEVWGHADYVCKDSATFTLPDIHVCYPVYIFILLLQQQ